MQLKDIPGIGDKTVTALERAGIHTVNELLHTYPRTYRTYEPRTTKSVKPGEWVVLRGAVTGASSHHTGRASTQRATFSDSQGRLELRWFNMPYLTRSLVPDGEYELMGRVELYASRLQIVAPTLKLLHNSIPTAKLIVPIYRQYGALKPWVLRTKIAATLDQLEPQPDSLSPDIISKYNLLDYWSAVEYIHQPPTALDLERAIRRLSWQELYQLQVESLQKKSRHPGIKLSIKKQEVKSFTDSLPFTLTPSQASAIDEILGDLGSGIATNRLLQGEVGSGKTAVAAALAYSVARSGYRTLVMAPTEILTQQLYETLSQYLRPHDIEVSLKTAGFKGDIQADVIVGTHALLNHKFMHVGLVIVDEQHRFGVAQREALVEAESLPHFVMMTATPIPRTLAMTLFSYLDITRLTDMPRGRLPVKTYFVPAHKRDDSYVWVKKMIQEGNKVFIVTPLIEKAEEQGVTPLKSVKELELTLAKQFPDIHLDIMHGQLGGEVKSKHMDKFRQGPTQILVATSMIEVGIDVPEANIIMIEDADRFGLSQLHQLRGRVGRGGAQGHCLLFTNNVSSSVKERLSYFIKHNDGAKLAKYDLQNRGSGELFGTQQHGFFNLALGSIWDEEMLRETSEAVMSVKQTLPRARRTGRIHRI